MKRAWLAGLVFFAGALAHGQVRVRDCEIVVAPNASPSEKFAAQELDKYLSEIVGKEIPIVDHKTGRPCIFIYKPGPSSANIGGRQTFVREGFSFSPESKGGFDGRSGNDLRVAGNGTRGVINAVYRLLQEYCSVRWWAPWAINVPKNPNLVLSIQSGNPDSPVEVEAPAFEVRDSYWSHTFDPAWALPNFDNGTNVQVDDSKGGKTQYAGGFVHTYYPLVPPEKYFATHPEWYSLINGKRSHDDAQLCTTNPELREFVAEQVKQELRANPNATIVSVSQNDCFNPCQCPICRALVAREGSESALTLDLANYVADHIKGEFPNVAVDTLAYQWSRHPPKTMRPRPNVIVRLCSIECNFAQPLFAPSNQDFANDIEGWHKLTNRLGIWDYCTDFANYMQPMPDYFSLGPTIKWFAENGVKGVFEEGDYTSPGGDMAELKAWLIAQMLWDPEQDPDKLILEFLNGYYGAAGPPIQSYLRLMTDAAKGTHVGFALGRDAPFLNYETMSVAQRLWARAESRVAKDPELLARVKTSELSEQFVWLTHWKQFRDAAAAKGDAWPMAPTLKEAAQAWLTLATGPGRPTGYPPITAIDEGGQKPAAFVASLGGQ